MEGRQTAVTELLEEEGVDREEEENVVGGSLNSLRGRPVGSLCGDFCSCSQSCSATCPKEHVAGFEKFNDAGLAMVAETSEGLLLFLFIFSIFFI